MRKILALLVLWMAALAHGQVIGLNPTPMAVYYWNTGTNSWSVCTNTSTSNAYSSTPQAFALYGFNSGLGQWTPQTSCPGTGGGGSGLISFQGRTTPAAVLTLSDVSTTLQTASSCNVLGYVYSPGSNACVPAGSTFTASGDLSGNASSQTVVGIQGHAVANFAPTSGQVLAWNVGLNEYVPSGINSPLFTSATQVPTSGTEALSYVAVGVDGSNAVLRQLTQDDILPGFSINSFACASCTTVEIGATVTNPAFTATYSSTPASAAITNTDGISSPTNLTTPFTSGTVTGAFTHTAAATTTFTLTAISTSTKTATRAITWAPRAFGGTGTGGSATGATASGNTAVLVGATGTLVAPTSGSALATSCTGQVYNVTTSGTQYVYLLLPCNVSNPSGGSFTTPGPTVFVMNAPTTISFTNQFGSVVTGYLYRSTSSFFDASNFIITVGN